MVVMGREKNIEKLRLHIRYRAWAAVMWGWGLLGLKIAEDLHNPAKTFLKKLPFGPLVFKVCVFHLPSAPPVTPHVRGSRSIWSLGVELKVSESQPPFYPPREVV
jgi:hypothetical protein